MKKTNQNPNNTDQQRIVDNEEFQRRGKEIGYDEALTEFINQGCVLVGVDLRHCNLSGRDFTGGKKTTQVTFSHNLSFKTTLDDDKKSPVIQNESEKNTFNSP